MLCSEGVHAHYQAYLRWLENTPDATLEQKRREADTLFRRFGITFNVYGEEEGTERLIPFDLIPRIIPSSEWNHLELGLRQRVTALNRFLHDIYHDQEILNAGIIPAEQVLTNQQFQTAMLGVDLPGNNYIPITGVDLIRDSNGEYFVLEDNLRTPSGVSYMLENRKMMMRLFPELFLAQSVAPVEHYPNLLLETLQSASDADSPCVVVLTPGRYNSAFFEHAFLAQQMGVPLVEGADLFVRNGCVFMRTTTGPRQVHVIYRRIDDAFLDPLAFNPDSMLGVPGLLSAYRDGNIILANALGTGVADDKSIYPYVPNMIRFYLDEEPILNNVPTWVCRREEDLSYVLDHLEELVVKEVHGAGGYGMLIGPKANRDELNKFRQLLRDNPANYIAQPTLCLSTCPTMVSEGIAPRHIDLRPFVLSGSEIKLVPGGLTRVALREGSLVVNSSQGGGTKDTWVLEGNPC
nr:circularly permuted type 2 ATP-grasp protein [Microbulbifer elongatus]